MNWKTFWDRRATSYDNPHDQVARTQKGNEALEVTHKKIASYIKDALNIKTGDAVLDVCCGNGMLSRELAEFCKELVGVDFSPLLIKVAEEQYAAKNISYLVGNAENLASLDIDRYDKIVLYFSFQYFDTYEQGAKVINQLKTKLKEGGKILIGDVPDHDRIHVFYPSYIQQIRYCIARWTGRDQMGKFWKEKEMIQMAQEVGLNIQRIEQPTDFLYRHYRVDYLLWL